MVNYFSIHQLRFSIFLDPRWVSWGLREQLLFVDTRRGYISAVTNSTLRIRISRREVDLTHRDTIIHILHFNVLILNIKGNAFIARYSSLELARDILEKKIFPKNGALQLNSSFFSFHISVGFPDVFVYRILRISKRKKSCGSGASSCVIA